MFTLNFMLLIIQNNLPVFHRVIVDFKLKNAVLTRECKNIVYL
jgi:hypothetical protein